MSFGSSGISSSVSLIVASCRIHELDVDFGQRPSFCALFLSLRSSDSQSFSLGNCSNTRELLRVLMIPRMQMNCVEKSFLIVFQSISNNIPDTVENRNETEIVEVLRACVTERAQSRR
ncbi:hypothetical protein K0M31_014501 [Melipona bicolor]|uniref:Uncharacterized protein n=1 Tax=Melipona bicolor TaxID=60889 RepID=A0AA40G8P1_9HYME|nr:hypothetical protein K0M31_014501 [Melipona bicolor]